MFRVFLLKNCGLFRIFSDFIKITSIMNGEVHRKEPKRARISTFKAVAKYL